jgi:hypothetical protein
MPKVQQKRAKPYNWNSKIMSAIRKIWRYSPERRAALKAAEHPAKHPADNLVLCAACGQWVHPKLADVDHIEPVVPVTGFDSFDAVIHRLQFNALAVLCDECHSRKTKAENAERAKHRKQLKKSRKS